MSKLLDNLVFIGRFMPYHNGHKAVITEATKRAKRVIIVLGSSDQAPDPKNPFTFEQRKSMIRADFPDNDIVFVKAFDYPYDDPKWVAMVQRGVNEAKLPGKVGLIGHSKDESSYYLKLFPMWKDRVDMANVDGIDATTIRKALFGTGDIDEAFTMIPDSTKAFLSLYSGTPEYRDMMEEVAFYKRHDEMWAAAPFTPTFQTVDSVVIQSGHVLMIQRKNAPGRNLWALPGGYINARGPSADKTLLDGAIRELKEETNIKVPVPVLRGSVVGQRNFDHPGRSLRGRIFTCAFHINLRSDLEMPKVRAADDAKDAKWIPLGELRRDQCFEDHYHIISYFTKID